jgi:type II secretory pathway pseudopilin PulG
MMRIPPTRLTRLAGEAGFAMPIVVAVSALLMIIAAAALTTGLNATTSSNRDREVKVARQAADSGLELALFDLNTVIAGQTLPCATRDAGGNYTMSGYAAGGEWCPPVTQTLADGSSIEYQVSKETPVAGTSPEQVVRKVVATGTYVGEQRRVYTELSARRGVAGFGIYGISAKDQITIINSAAIGTTTNPVNVRTNGDIRMENYSYVCGDVTPGPGKALTKIPPATICPGKSTAPATAPLLFDDYVAEHNAAWTTNDNARLGCTPAGAAKDHCSNPSMVNWDASKRELIVEGNAELTLSGNTYSLCRLNLKNNSRLFIATRPASSPMRFYFGSPEQCGGQTENVMIENGWGITNHNTDPTTLQFFVRGAADKLTRVNIKNNTANSSATPFMLYAPNSEVILENHARIVGGIVGKTVDLKNNVTFNYDPNAATPTGSTALVYQPSGHRECSPVPTGAPDSGC